MAGNVREWVEDCWHKTYEQAPSDGRSWLEEAGGDCGLRVLRGESWLNGPDGLRSSDRNAVTPDFRNYLIGFRLVCRPYLMLNTDL